MNDNSAYDAGALAERDAVAGKLGRMVRSALADVGRAPERPDARALGRIEGLQEALAYVDSRKDGGT